MESFGKYWKRQDLRPFAAMPEGIPEDPDACKWAGFISHHQAGASRTVQFKFKLPVLNSGLNLKEWIEKNLKERGHRLTGLVPAYGPPPCST